MHDVSTTHDQIANFTKGADDFFLMPLRYFTTTASMRRFFSLPSGVSFPATGLSWPYPFAVRRSAALPYLSSSAVAKGEGEARRGNDTFAPVEQIEVTHFGPQHDRFGWVGNIHNYIRYRELL